MKVKIGDKIYDSKEQPIMLILDPIDKQSISWMGDQREYCDYPEGMDINKIIKFMEEKVVETPKELFKFDMEDIIRKTMPECLMETEGLTEEEAIEETEKMIEISKDMTKFCKNEIENIRCNFMEE